MGRLAIITFLCSVWKLTLPNTAELVSSMNECKISYVYLRVTLHLQLNKRFKSNSRLTLQWHLRVTLCSLISSWSGGVAYFKGTLVFTRVEALLGVCGLKPKHNPGNPLCRWPTCPVSPLAKSSGLRWHTLAFQIVNRTLDTTEFVFLKVTLKCLLMCLRCWKRKKGKKKERGGGMVGGGREGRKASYEIIYIKSKENKEEAQPETGKSKIWVLSTEL